MEIFTTLSGVAAPLPWANVDTDLIAPGEAMKTVTKDGLAPHLFARVRYLPDGSEDPDFMLNKPPYRNAKILIARENFGCGSSREHAVWALKDFGIRCVIAPSFADIFFLNAFRNGMLLIALAPETVEVLLGDAAKGANAILSVDLEAQVLTRPDGEAVPFAIDALRKEVLLHGRTDAERITEGRLRISAYEEKMRRDRPWLWPTGEMR